MALLIHDEPAIHVYDLPGHAVAKFTREKNADPSHVDRLQSALQRLLGDNGGQLFWSCHLFLSFHFDSAWSDAVDMNIVRTHLARHCTSQADHSTLGCNVVAEHRAARVKHFETPGMGI